MGIPNWTKRASLTALNWAPEKAEVVNNLAPARTVPSKRGGATGFLSMPDVEEPARFVCQVPSVGIASHLGPASRNLPSCRSSLFAFEERKICSGPPRGSSARLHRYVVARSPVCTFGLARMNPHGQDWANCLKCTDEDGTSGSLPDCTATSVDFALVKQVAGEEDHGRVETMASLLLSARPLGENM